MLYLNKKSTDYSKCSDRGKTHQNAMKDHGDTVSYRKNDNSPEIKSKDMEDCGIAGRKLKIIVVKKLNELQKSSERKFNRLRNTSKKEQQQQQKL